MTQGSCRTWPVQSDRYSGHFTGTSARCHHFFPDTGCPLKVTCDSCCITAHLVALLPKSFPDPLAVDTIHDKKLGKKASSALKVTPTPFVLLFPRDSDTNKCTLVSQSLSTPLSGLNYPPILHHTELFILLIFPVITLPSRVLKIP